MPDSPAPDDQVAFAITVRAGVDLRRLALPKRPGDRMAAHESAGDELQSTLRSLENEGFRVSGIGRRTISLRASVGDFERVFQTKLAARGNVKPDRWGRPDFIAGGFDWRRSLPQLEKVVEAVELQSPHQYLSALPVPSALPPPILPPALDLRADLPVIARKGAGQPMSRGAEVIVAMVDSGFDLQHGFFTTNGYALQLSFPLWATPNATDLIGHGTAMCANFFVLAPRVRLIGVKLHNDRKPALSATTLEGLQHAMTMQPQPHIISLSSAIDLRDANGQPGPVNGACSVLAAEMEDLIGNPGPNKQCIFVCSAGNGQHGFPAQMPGVIAVGGAYSDSQGAVMKVAGFSSHFTSVTYQNRVVPDVCGVLGLLPQETAVMLPVPPGSDEDTGRGFADGTSGSDGWAVFGGTSAATPQVAALCAVILQRHPDLSANAVKQAICGTARPISDGSGAVDARGGKGMIDFGAALQAAAALDS